MAKKLTAQQKAERGRTAMRKLSKAGALEKSITFKKPLKGKKATLPENR